MQGPYEWHMMDAWLANGFVGEDLLVNRAGDSDWIALRDMAAKRAREGPRAPRRPGGAAPPPAPRPGASNAAEVEKKPIGDSDVADTSGEKKRPVAVSSRYTESVDARIARLVAEGKFGPALTRLATGRGKAGELLAAGGGLASGRSSPALGAASPASDAVGAKRKSPLGEDAEKGAERKKRATAPSLSTANEKEKPEKEKIKNEWRHADGYAQLPVFEPAKPVEVPSGATKNAAPDPRKKRSLSSSDKKRSESEPSVPPLDLPVPAWCVEDAIERRRMASGFDRGGPRPAADPKADDSDGEGSDVSWSALPGTGEPAELLEERKKAKQEAMSRANADLEAAEAAAADARLQPRRRRRLRRTRRRPPRAAPRRSSRFARWNRSGASGACPWRATGGVGATTAWTPRRFGVNWTRLVSAGLDASSRAAKSTTRSESSASPVTAKRFAGRSWTRRRRSV